MPDYHHTITVNCDADQVFEFVSNPANLPKYLPTVHDARPQGEDRVEVSGQAAGHTYHSDGPFNVDREAKSMTWGSDGENHYKGRLEVSEDGGMSLIDVTLSFDPRPDQDQQFESQTGSRDRTIDEGIRAALESIRNHCEGTGTKVKSSGDRQQGYAL